VDYDTYQVVDTYRYAPFGGLLAGGASDNNRRFTGETQACPEPAEGTPPGCTTCGRATTTRPPAAS